MQTKDALRASLEMSHRILTTVLSDLSDAELLERPVPTANHIAWQLGHLIASERRMLETIPGANCPELPAGFAEQHGKETAAQQPAHGFASKAHYQELHESVRAATLIALDKLPDGELDTPVTGPIARLAPTLGKLFLLASSHEMMHAGQFSVVRRKLGKPVLF